MMMLTAADVTGRCLFNKPLLGAFKLTEFLVLNLNFSFLTHTQALKTQVAVDLLLERSPKKPQTVIRIFNHAAGLFLMGLFIWMTLFRVLELQQFAEASSNLNLPKYTFAFFVVIGGIYSGVRTPTEAAGIGASGPFFVYNRRHDGDSRVQDVTGYCDLPVESCMIRSAGSNNTLKRRRML